MAIGTVIGRMRVSSLTAGRMTLTPIGRKTHVNLPEMVRVAGGKFSMGSTRFTDAQPLRQVTLRDFAIGKYPVTNGEYLGFLQAMNREIPQLVASTKFALHPVVDVSWNNATEYCKFLMETTGRKFGLLTEAQWEYAAGGTGGRTYPWGNEWDASKAVFNTSGTQPVSTHPEGASWCGAMHMSGNVWEWVQDWYANGYDAKALTNPTGPDSGTYKVLRGGSWYNSDSNRLDAAYRICNLPEFQYYNIGFRLAEDLK
ncbi:MAG: SUMF1/EgtB/PvdO family nonheme iron enzyme [Candidatus Saganbacteria bacterium]|nr:SUMF1/EgtB/PvdO family nonheme iron enzyme [Candidatus Saganbacteria bacterium]